MQKYIFLLFTIIPGVIFSQESEIYQVEKVVENLFKGMFEGDSSRVHACFTDDVRMLTTVKDEAGQDQLRSGDLIRFLTAVGTPHEEVWDEQIKNLKIDVDGGLAHAWMDYTFFVGDKLSHCGVNAMQLVKVNGEWKIIHLIDTRRKSGCSESD